MIIKRLLASCVFIFFFLATIAQAINLPKPAGFVNDFAGILSPETRASLEASLVDFEKQTSNEIVVVTVFSFEGLDSFSYSQELFIKWGIGKEDKNNGVVLLLGPVEGLPFPERGDVFINVGKGLEGALPDSLTGTIIRQEIVPQFKNKNFSQGILNGVSAIMQAVKGEYKASPSDNKSSSGSMVNFLLNYGFLIAWIVIIYLGSFLGRTKSWWLGGVIGGVAGLALSFIFFTGIIIAISTGISAVAGLIFDYVVSKNYAYRKAQGKPTDFWRSGGGFWFGGRGGGFGSGGFGGFGGGISGGGGAGGRW